MLDIVHSLKKEDTNTFKQVWNTSWLCLCTLDFHRSDLNQNCPRRNWQCYSSKWGCKRIICSQKDHQLLQLTSLNIILKRSYNYKLFFFTDSLSYMLTQNVWGNSYHWFEYLTVNIFKIVKISKQSNNTPPANLISYIWDRCGVFT